MLQVYKLLTVLGCSWVRLSVVIYYLHYDSTREHQWPMVLHPVWRDLESSHRPFDQKSATRHRLPRWAQGNRGATQINLKADYQITDQYTWDGNDLGYVNQVWIWSVLHSLSKGPQNAAGSKTTAWVALLIGCLYFKLCSGVCKYS